MTNTSIFFTVTVNTDGTITVRFGTGLFDWREFNSMEEFKENIEFLISFQSEKLEANEN